MPLPEALPDEATVERVARAICVALGNSSETPMPALHVPQALTPSGYIAPSVPQTEPLWHAWKEVARAVIAAVPEPVAPYDFTARRPRLVDPDLDDGWEAQQLDWKPARVRD